MTPDSINNDLKALHVAYVRRDRLAMRHASLRLAEHLADLAEAMPCPVSLPPMPATLRREVKQ